MSAKDDKLKAERLKTGRLQSELLRIQPVFAERDEAIECARRINTDLAELAPLLEENPRPATKDGSMNYILRAADEITRLRREVDAKNDAVALLQVDEVIGAPAGY